MGEAKEKILSRIKCDHITPVPRWHFLVRNYMLWSVFAVAIVVGGVSFSLAIHVLAENDWDVYRYLHMSFTEHILFSLPYFWLVFLLGVLVVAYFDFACTKGGYRHRRRIVLLASFGLTSAVGVSLYYLGLAKDTDDFIDNAFPAYRSVTDRNAALWSNPERGTISGEIIDDRGTEFVIMDFNGNRWVVLRASNAPELKVAAPVRLDSANVVKVVGKVRDRRKFEAEEIREWEGSAPVCGACGKSPGKEIE